MAYPAPYIIRQSTPMLAEEYRTTPTTIGQFNCTDAAANKALLVAVPHCRPSGTDTYGLTDVRFNGVSMTFVGTQKTIANDLNQPRVSIYVMPNPPQVNGNIDLTFNAEMLSGAATSTTVAVQAFLLGNVHQTTPIGTVNNTYRPYQDSAAPFWIYFDAPISLATANGLLLGFYHGTIAARNNMVLRGSTVEVYKGALDYPTSSDRMWWVGKQLYTTTGTKYFTFDQKTYGDDVANIYVEIRSSNPAPQINLSDVVTTGTSPVVTFSNLTNAIPSTVTLSDGTLTQSLPVVNTAGTYTVTVPAITANRVKFGNAKFFFTDGADNVQADFVYKPGTLWYYNLAANASSAAYIGWSTPPQIGDQIVYNNLLTNSDTSGNLAAYADGVYTFYHVRGSDGVTAAFNVTFGEVAQPSVNPTGTSTTLQAGSTGIVKINHNGFNPVDVVLKDPTSKTATNVSYTWDSGTSTLTYSVKHNAEAFKQPLSLVVRMNNGATLTTTVTLTGLSGTNTKVSIPFKRYVKQRATKPYFNGSTPDDTV